VLGTLNPGGQDLKRVASNIEAIGKQAFVGFVQRIGGIVKLGSLAHGEFILALRQSIVAGGAFGGQVVT
jgi:hypothetical protein